jgi:hypothetical protein
MINNTEPWVDIPTARILLRWLVTADDWASDSPLIRLQKRPFTQKLATWLTQHGLGALAYGRTTAATTDLRACLQGDMFSAAAESSLKQTSLQAIVGAFSEAQIPLTLLKGAALSLPIPPGAR